MAATSIKTTFTDMARKYAERRSFGGPKRRWED
jgi:hypothetical protein